MEKFFQRSLSKEEEAEFANLMATDKIFASEIAWELKLRHILTADLEKKTELTPPESARIEPPKVVSLYRRPMVWAVVAAVAFLVVFNVGYSLFKNNTDGKVVAASFDKYMDENSINRQIEALLSEYKPAGGGENRELERFENVQNVFKSTSLDSNHAIDEYKNAQLRIYYAAQLQLPLAKVYRKIGNYAAAIEIYQAILENRMKDTEGVESDVDLGLSIKQQVEKQLILTFVEAKQVTNPNFKNLMKKIENDSNHLFYPEIGRLNQQLNTFWWRLVN
ncbi:MAG: tetratricopeptide repeat-containing protein [Saprospiraceae bacterium]|nr:tetratricopeptide repeat-containing protein [Saprospiraceae bacterium]